MNQSWQFWAGTGAALQPVVTQGGQWPGITHVTLTTAAAGYVPPVTMHYGTDVQGNRYTAMTSTVTAQAAWSIQYIARAYGGEEVTVKGLTWRVRALTMEELG